MTNLYRRRPAEIEAVQWTDTNADALTTFAGQRFMTVDPEDRIDDADATASLRESAHECWSLLRPGDWVVKRGEDDFAVLTPEKFADLYEATDEIQRCPQHPDAYGYEHPACGFHWHGKDGMDVPLSDGEPVCPRCALAEVQAMLNALQPSAANRAASIASPRQQLAEQEQQSTERAAALLAPLEAKARALRAQLDAKHRADVLREAATVAEEFSERYPEMDDMKAAGIIGPNTMAGAIGAELRRIADEAQPAEEQPETCAHCGKTILRITGTLAAWWVHDPDGHTICDPQQAASSPRATPKPAVEARQDRAQPLLTLATPCAACTHPYNWHQGGICQAGADTNRCGCIAFAVAQQDGAQS